MSEKEKPSSEFKQELKNGLRETGQGAVKLGAGALHQLKRLGSWSAKWTIRVAEVTKKALDKSIEKDKQKKASANAPKKNETKKED